MKKIYLLTLAAAVLTNTLSAQDQKKSLSHFTKIVASPHISVILQKGDKESIRLNYANVTADKVNVKVTGNTLRIYLDHARITEKQERMGNQKQGIYHDASVTAYISYRDIKSLEIRGEEELSCEGEIKTTKLKLRAYGESEIRLGNINVRKFKASLYGRNDLKVRSGEALHQTFRSFGENKIDTHAMKSETASTRVYGEGRISVFASEKISISAFGEPEIKVSGSGHVAKGIVLGRVDIHSQH